MNMEYFYYEWSAALALWYASPLDDGSSLFDNVTDAL